MAIKEILEEYIPCNKCIHNKVCNARKQFKEVVVNTPHPYIIVKLECTEFYQDIRQRRGGIDEQ